MSAMESSREFAPKIGKKTYKLVTRHIERNVAPLPPAPADSWDWYSVQVMCGCGAPHMPPGKAPSAAA